MSRVAAEEYHSTANTYESALIYSGHSKIRLQKPAFISAVFLCSVQQTSIILYL